MLHDLLLSKFTYYQNLSVNGQEKFKDRVRKFMYAKNFVGHEGLEITNDIKALISASAVQLTFGLSDFSISHLHTVNVFPHVFYSRLYETHFKGLTTKNGVLAISWQDFEEGYSDSRDKINLGLHELSHTLHVDIELDGNTDRHFSIYYDKWKRFATTYLEDVKNGHITFLRKYGATNIHEFFAVCIEHFFEAPYEFQAAIPELYSYIVSMLNQDPTNTHNDYSASSVTHSTPLRKVRIGDGTKNYPRTEDAVITRQDKINYYLKTEGVNVAMFITFAGLFAGIPTLFWMASVTIIETPVILLLLLACGGLGMLQWRFVRNNLDMAFYQFAMYAFTGFGMCLLNLLLLFNHFVSVDSYQVHYSVNGHKMNNNGTEIVIFRDDFESGLERNISSFLHDHYGTVPNATSATVTFDKGILGFDHIREFTFYE